ncbi:helix-turn-helix transcriptional regulator [Paenarthrobacter sp. JL.01a]|uniref:helix-turn-helix transcriptional regulator n=1 Tax=Paenarthrobacter sp. JL.01a TaxID=2979324 RepID=UPI0021C94F99|nr:helix-turn-helix domain-containing protein [Paenarthrobacter sp. JL.01a]UXM92493.1 helix-turn-helix domain-containing protein [Paenarthrobacter sp. JL.01a]
MSSSAVAASGSPMPGEPLPASPYMTRKQVAAYLNVTEKWLAEYKASGPRFYKFGSRCRYLRDDVLNWARQQRATRH